MKNITICVFVLACFALLSVSTTESKSNEVSLLLTGMKPMDDYIVYHDSRLPHSKRGKSNYKENICSKIYDPVCGSNGKIYNNYCQFTNAQKKDSELTLQNEGEC